MTAPESFLLGLYFALLACLSVYGLHRCFLIYLYTKHRTSVFPGSDVNLGQVHTGGTDSRCSEASVAWPLVTVQLPVYNEMHVVSRLVEAVTGMDYPKDRVEFQLLDDSADDDETGQLARRACDRAAARGVQIRYMRRRHRVGFKAGALANGLRLARGDLIAVFDADFVPHRHFLQQVVRPFDNPIVGMVQARWGHLNREYSILTRIQAIFLDAHFVLEHGARYRGGLFFNFNGTAGIWRREAIESGGGWHDDTLTEDLDLSYRAQLAGWKFVFLENLVAPAELPVEMAGFKTQQFRWARGSIQTCYKLLPSLFRSGIPFRNKAEAFFHLTANFNYPLLLLLCVVMVPALFLRLELGTNALLYFEFPLFCVAVLSLTNFYALSQHAVGENWINQFRYLPLLMAVGLGLTINNSLAVLGCRLDGRYDFERTPKYAVVGRGDDWRAKRYRQSSVVQPLIEFAFGLYYTAAVAYSWEMGFFVLIPVLCLFQVGFFYNGLLPFLQLKSWGGGPLRSVLKYWSKASRKPGSL